MSPEPGPYRILVVDDEPAVLVTYCLILEQKGYQVAAAATAVEARDALDGQQLDLMLCDLSLQGQDSGFDVIAYAREQHPSLPCILLTGYADPAIEQRAQSQGLLVLFKPIQIREFLRTIAEHLGGSAKARAMGE